jgi:hypothetical protein
MIMFLVPVIILFLISLAGWGYVVVALSPDKILSVILFLVTLFLTLTTALSLLIFSLHRRFFYQPQRFTALGPVSDPDELRKIYRRSLLISVTIALIALAALVYAKIR